MNEEWKFWTSSRTGSTHSAFLQYGTTAMLTLFAVFLVLRVPGLIEAPYFLLLAAVVLSAFYGGLGPGLWSLSLCVLAVIFLFLGSAFPTPSIRQISFDDGARFVGFAWVSVILSLLIAGSKRSRDNLQRSEERYRSLVQTAPDAIAVVDARGLIIFVTPAVEKLFQCPSDRMLGLPLNLFIPGCFCQRHLTEMKTNLDTRQTLMAIELTGRNSHGETIPLEISFGFFTYNDQNAFSAFLRDRRKLRTQILLNPEAQGDTASRSLLGSGGERPDSKLAIEFPKKGGGASRSRMQAGPGQTDGPDGLSSKVVNFDD